MNRESIEINFQQNIYDIYIYTSQPNTFIIYLYHFDKSLRKLKIFYLFSLKPNLLEVLECSHLQEYHQQVFQRKLR